MKDRLEIAVNFILISPKGMYGCNENVEAKVDAPKGLKPSLIGMITSPVHQFVRMRERPVIWLR